MSGALPSGLRTQINFPFALSLSKGRPSFSAWRAATRKEQHFDKLSTNGFWGGVVAVAFAAFATPALAQDIAIINATVVIGDGGEPIRGGTVVVRGGKVAAAGAGVAVPAGMTAIDAQGKWVTPGLVVAVTDVGLYDVEGVEESNDASARSSPFDAALDIAPAINPQAQHFQVSRSGGVTRAAIAPTSSTSIFAGQGAIVDFGDDPQAVTRPRAFQYVELGETGAQRAGGSRVSA